MTSILSWLYGHTRPQFHYATVVVAFGAWIFLFGLAPLAIIFAVAAPEFSVRYEFLAHVIGTCGLGALVAGHVHHYFPSGAYHRWFVAATFGGTAGAAFAALVNLRLDRSVAQGAAAGLGIGAASGLILLWLALRPSQNRDQNAA